MTIVKKYLQIPLLFVCLSFPFVTEGHSCRVESLTLPQAWQHVLHCNPGLKSSCYGISAAKGELIQAGVVPNPSVSVIAENIGDSDSNQQQVRDQEQPQSTLLLTQPIELGGKRGLRIHTASHKYHASILNYHADRGAAFLQTVQLFLAVAETEAKLHLAEQAVKLNRQTVETIQKRAKAGRASELELKAAQITLADQVLATKTAEQQNESARYALATLWGGCIDEVPSVTLCGFECDSLPNLPCLMQQLEFNPLLQALKQKVYASRAQISLSRANGIPDVTAGLGVRHFSDTNNTAYVAQVSVPLTLFDRNQGNTFKANAEYCRAQQEWQEQHNNVKKDLFATYQIACQANLQVRSLQNTIIPRAKKALELARQGYLQGRFSYLDLLSAQQKLLDEQSHHLSSLYTFRKAWITLQVLTGALPPKEII